MEAINSKSINESVLNNSKQTLSKIERALTMIDDPDFGLGSTQVNRLKAEDC